jgi:hypothetical protein
LMIEKYLLGGTKRPDLEKRILEAKIQWKPHPDQKIQFFSTSISR